MRRSMFFVPMQRDNRIDSSNKSGSYLEQMGIVAQVGAGMYTHLPFGFALFDNVKRTLNAHLLEAGCSLHQFPALQPVSIWKDQGRFEIFGKTIFAFKDQHGKEVCIAPTHEVLAANTAKRFIHSYRDMPVRISQIQTKFRDEIRPRAGVIRTREFTMHDLYSFDAGREAADESYRLIRKAYEDTLCELRIPYTVRTQHDMGDIGGDLSHEFHVPCESGEDSFEGSDGKTYKSLEIAHIFMLGDKYTRPVNATYQTRNGNQELIYMCSYGLGIERTVAAYLEAYLVDGKDLVWPLSLTPFELMVIGDVDQAKPFYEKACSNGIAAIFEDRDLPFGQQLGEAFRLGFPFYTVFGKRYRAEGLVELRAPRLNETAFVSEESLLPAISELRERIIEQEIADWKSRRVS